MDLPFLRKNLAFLGRPDGRFGQIWAPGGGGARSEFGQVSARYEKIGSGNIGQILPFFEPASEVNVRGPSKV